MAEREEDSARQQGGQGSGKLDDEANELRAEQDSADAMDAEVSHGDDATDETTDAQ